MNKYIVLYIGLDEKTFSLLNNSENFEVIQANFISDLLTSKTSNPFDQLFKLIYKLRYLNKYRDIELFLLKILRIFDSFLSILYKKYFSYLTVIVEKNISIIDLDRIQDSVKSIRDNHIDVAIVNNWWLLPKEIIDAPKYKTVNIHPSKLPQYRGSLPTLWSLKNHDPISAVSYIVLQEKMDNGDILMQHDFNISKEDDAITVEHKIDTVIKDTIVEDLLHYLNGNIILKTQDNSKSSATAKYFDYLKIDWYAENVRDIYNKILLYPYLWPLDKCYTLLNQNKIFISKACISNKSNLKPGEFVCMNGVLQVGAIDGSLEILLLRNLTFYDSILLSLVRKSYFDNKT